jgi:hypothetical protein
MSENELLLCLGRETVGDAAVPQSLGSLIDRGRNILQEVEPWLKKLVCDADGPKPFLEDLSHEALHSAVVAIIVGTAGFSFPHIAAIYLAAVIVRRGLQNYCGVPAAADDAKLASKSDTPES